MNKRESLGVGNSFVAFWDTRNKMFDLPKEKRKYTSFSLCLISSGAFHQLL